MYRCESWTIKKAECQRTDAFQLWCCRRLLRVPWTARGSNQPILKEINPEYSLEGLILKLKIQYFGHLIGRADSLEKTLTLGKIESRRRGWQRMRWLDGITAQKTWAWENCGRQWVGKPGMLQFKGSQRHTTQWLNNNQVLCTVPDPKELGSLPLRSLQFISKDVDLVVSSKEYNWIHKGWQTGFWRLEFKTEEQRATKNSVLDGGDAEAANGSRTTFTRLFCYLPSSTVTRRRREKGLLFVLIRPLVEWRIQFSVPLLWKTNLQIKDHPGKPLEYRRDQYKQRLKELGRFILENKRLSENLISVFKSLTERKQTCVVEFQRVLSLKLVENSNN